MQTDLNEQLKQHFPGFGALAADMATMIERRVDKVEKIEIKSLEKRGGSGFNVIHGKNGGYLLYNTALRRFYSVGANESQTAAMAGIARMLAKAGRLWREDLLEDAIKIHHLKPGEIFSPKELLDSIMPDLLTQGRRNSRRYQEEKRTQKPGSGLDRENAPLPADTIPEEKRYLRLTKSDRWMDFVDMLPGFKKLVKENYRSAFGIYAATEKLKYQSAEQHEYDTADCGTLSNVKICRGLGFLELELKGDRGFVVLSKDLKQAFVYTVKGKDHNVPLSIAKKLLTAAGWGGPSRVDFAIEYRGNIEENGYPCYYELGKEIAYAHRAATASATTNGMPDGMRRRFVEELIEYYTWCEQHHKLLYDANKNKGDKQGMQREAWCTKAASHINAHLPSLLKHGFYKTSLGKVGYEEYGIVYGVLRKMLSRLNEESLELEPNPFAVPKIEKKAKAPTVEVIEQEDSPPINEADKSITIELREEEHDRDMKPVQQEWSNAKRVFRWVKQNAPSMIVGGVFGAGVRVAAQFAVAATLTTTPGILGVLGAAMFVGGVTGGATNLLVTGLFGKEKKEEKNWALKAMGRGALFGAAGGAAFAGLTHWLMTFDSVRDFVHSFAHTTKDVASSANQHATVPAIPDASPQHAVQAPASAPKVTTPTPPTASSVAPSAPHHPAVTVPVSEPPSVTTGAPSGSTAALAQRAAEETTAAATQAATQASQHTQKISDLITPEQLASLPSKIRHLASSAKPLDQVRFCKEASFAFFNGAHKDTDAGARLLQLGLETAKKQIEENGLTKTQAKIYKHALQSFHADLAFWERWQNQDVTAALKHACKAGRAVNNYGARLLRLQGAGC